MQHRNKNGQRGNRSHTTRRGDVRAAVLAAVGLLATSIGFVCLIPVGYMYACAVLVAC